MQLYNSVTLNNINFKLQIIDVDNKSGYELITETLNSLESTVRHVLLIRKARSFDFGRYNCSAQNELGETHMLITVQHQRKSSF